MIRAIGTCDCKCPRAILQPGRSRGLQPAQSFTRTRPRIANGHIVMLGRVPISSPAQRARRHRQSEPRTQVRRPPIGIKGCERPRTGAHRSRPYHSRRSMRRGGRGARRAIGGHVTSTSEMNRFETEILTTRKILRSLTDGPENWIEPVRQHSAFNDSIRDPNNSESETYQWSARRASPVAMEHNGTPVCGQAPLVKYYSPGASLPSMKLTTLSILPSAEKYVAGPWATPCT